MPLCRWGHTLLYAPKAVAFSGQLEFVTEDREACLLEFVTYTSLIHTLNWATCRWGLMPPTSTCCSSGSSL